MIFYNNAQSVLIYLNYGIDYYFGNHRDLLDKRTQVLPSISLERNSVLVPNPVQLTKV